MHRRMRHRLVLHLLACLVANSVALTAGHRASAIAQQGDLSSNVWNIGGAEVRAEFVRLTDDGVILRRRSDGKEAEIPLSRLSFADQLRALKLGKPEAFNKPLPKAEPKRAVTEVPRVDPDELLQYPFDADITLRQWAEIVEREANAGHAAILWHMLTPKMQNDIAEILALAMQKVAPLRTSLQELINLMATVAREKKQFILEHPIFKNDPQRRAMMEEAWPQLSQFLDILADPSLWEEHNFEKENIIRWLARLHGETLPSLQALQDTFAGGSMQQLPPPFEGLRSLTMSQDEEVSLVVINEEKDEGVIEISAQGKPIVRWYMIRIDGRWTSKTLLSDWDSAMNKAKQRLTQLDPQSFTMPRFFLQGLVGQLKLMAAAETQQLFNEAFQAVLDLFGQMPGLESVTGSSGSPGVGTGAAPGPIGASPPPRRQAETGRLQLGSPGGP
ncbi:MAG: hypothetical protein KatS3mg111_2695 [Pirellulaceae bacterium]|nr:MAG: hypothetical protein KatS3mg111_2695 [Pirellulaceae bacterium]